jgi:hypothetical protein
MRKLILIAVLLLALPVQAQPLTIGGGDNVESVLQARKGKQVTLRLTGGQELTGTVTVVTPRMVSLSALSGREFFDAAIPLEKIEAVIVRTKQ